jgi:cell division protein FtsZ
MQINQKARITAVGVGSAGVRIASMMSGRRSMIEKFVYVSCDREDLAGKKPEEGIHIASPVDQKLTPSMARGLAVEFRPQVAAAIAGSEVVFVIAGLGGASGSGLSPMVASIAQDCGAVAVGVAVMPFEFEANKRFYAGVSLRRLRACSRGVIVVDNDTLLRSVPDESTFTEFLDLANEEAARVLGSLFSIPAENTVPVGLNKVMGTVLQDGYSLLGVSRSGAVDKAEDALAGAVVSLGKLAETKEANRAVVLLSGDSSLSVQEVGLVVKRLGSMMNSEEVDVEYGVTYSGQPQLQVGILASGFRSTKYDDYDPLQKVLEGRTLDDDMDSSIFEGLEALQPCD